MNNKETINTYFTLFDSIDKQPEALEQVLSLFSSDSVIIAADGSIFKGKNSVEEFFKNFFVDNVKVEHVWSINENTGLSADWTATVTTAERKTSTSEGTDYYTFDTDGKIKELKMEVK